MVRELQIEAIAKADKLDCIRRRSQLAANAEQFRLQLQTASNFCDLIIFSFRLHHASSTSQKHFR